MSHKQPSTGRYDVDKCEVTPGSQVIVCNGYAYRTRRYDLSLKAPAKRIFDGPVKKTVYYCDKSVVDENELKTRSVTRPYSVEYTDLNVGKVGLVVNRNRHNSSLWDVLLDGLLYAVSSKYLKVLKTQCDLSTVQDAFKNQTTSQT